MADETFTFTLEAKEVSPQSYRALAKMIESRGPEPMREALWFILQGLRHGDVVLTAAGQ